MPRDLSRLFHHNPLRDKRHLRRLFVNRKTEIEMLKERVLKPKHTLDLVFAVHGVSRVGKSHLAFRALLDTKRWNIIEVYAAEGRRARWVLQDIHNELRECIIDVKEPVVLEPEGVSSQGLLRDTKTSMAFLGDFTAADRAETKTIKIKEGTEFSFGVKVISQIFGLNVQDKTTAGTEQEIKIPRLDDYQLVKYLAMLAEMLATVTGKGCLIYVDDVDLLEMGCDEEQKEAIQLINHLSSLAEYPQIAVLVSIRSRHIQTGQKRLRKAVLVEALTNEEMRQIHDNHIKLFNRGEVLFDDECLEKLIEMASGRPGNFLWNCHELWDWGWLRNRLRPEGMTVDDLVEFLTDMIREFSVDATLKDYVEEIRSAFLNGELEVELDPAVCSTDLIFVLLDEPNVLHPTRFGIISFAGDVLKRMNEENRGHHESKDEGS